MYCSLALFLRLLIIGVLDGKTPNIKEIAYRRYDVVLDSIGQLCTS